MRWFKHLTETRNDEKIARLISKGGHAAYGLWWMVLESIARQIDNGTENCSVCYPVRVWAAQLSLRPCNVRRSLAVLVATGLLQMRDTNAGLDLSVPNLLKFRDEWQRRLSSDSGARIQSQKQIQMQKQIQTNVLGDFEPDRVKELLHWMSEMLLDRKGKVLQWTRKQEASLATLAEKSSPKEIKGRFKFYLTKKGGFQGTLPLAGFLKKELTRR